MVSNKEPNTQFGSTSVVANGSSPLNLSELSSILRDEKRGRRQPKKDRRRRRRPGEGIFGTKRIQVLAPKLDKG